MVSAKTVGAAMMVTAIILFIVGFLYVHSAEAALTRGHTLGPNGECVHPAGAICPYADLNKLQLPKYTAFAIDCAIFIIGLILFIRPEPGSKPKPVKTPKTLSAEERTVFRLIADAQGMLMQSELVEKTGLSKVSITRILDKLEGRSLIERKRRGMTNLVVLKENKD